MHGNTSAPQEQVSNNYLFSVEMPNSEIGILRTSWSFASYKPRSLPMLFSLWADLVCHDC